MCDTSHLAQAVLGRRFRNGLRFLGLTLSIVAATSRPAMAGSETRLRGLPGLPASAVPGFSSDQTTYTAAVDTPFLPLTPQAMDAEAVVEVRANGGAFARVAPGSPLSVDVNYLLAVKSDGRIVQWGTNNYDGLVVPPSDLTDVVSVASGYAYNLALRKNGTVRAWGAPGINFLGAIAAQTEVAAIFADSTYAFLIKKDGSLMSWGMPLPAGGVSQVVSVCQNLDAALAAKTDGTVVAWNRSGFVPSLVPAGLSDVTMVACNNFNYAALRRDGTLHVWPVQPGGFNAISVPPGLKDIVSISAGGAYFLALGKDGTVTALGTGPGTRVPAGLQGVTAIEASVEFSAALKNDGTLVTWGNVPYDNLPPPQGNQFVSWPATVPVALAGGPNVVDIRVTPPAGTPPRTYTLQVNRTPNPALRWLSPDRGSLVPPFAPGVTSYSLSLPFASDGIRFLPVTQATGTTLQWNGSPLAADVPSALLPLSPGANAFVFRARADDGATSREYQVSITREPPATARSLRFLADNAGALTPTFSPDHLSYTHAAPVRQPTLRLWPKVGAVSSRLEVRVNGGPYTRLSSGNSSAFGAVIQPDGMPFWWDPTDLTKSVTTEDPVVPCGGITTGFGGYLAIRTDGTLLSRDRAWAKVPDGLSGVVELTEVLPVNGAPTVAVALLGTGTVRAWETQTGQPVSLFPNENQIVTLAGGRYLTAIRRDGTLAVWSPPVDPYPLSPLEPAPTDLVACSASTPASVLRRDGTSIAWGPGPFEPVYTSTGVAGLVPGFGFDYFHLRQDGRLGVPPGYLPALTFPEALQNVLFARSNHWYHQAVRADGEVIVWAYANGNFDGTGVPAGLKARAHPESIVVPLLIGENLIELRVGAEDGTHSLYTLAVSRVPNLDLASVSVNDGEFPIDLGTGATGFALTVPSNRENLTFQASLQDVTGTMTLNGLALAPGAKAPVALAPGLNTLTLVVTDQNQATSRTYTFSVTRQLIRADLASLATSAGPVTPSFSANTRQYALTTNRPDLVVWPIPDGADLEARTHPAGEWKKMSRGSLLARGSSGFTAWVTSSGTVSIEPVGALPGAPSDLTDAVSIAAGSTHLTALRREGTVVSWGYGPGSATPAGLVGIRAIAAAADYSLALRNDGTVTGWGNNSHGQLTPPAGLNDVVAINAQGGPTPWALALRRDGTVAAWGAGLAGPLAVPPGLQGVVAISGLASVSFNETQFHTRAVALMDTGRVVLWDIRTGTVEPEFALLHDIVKVSGKHALRRDGVLIDLVRGERDFSMPTAAALEDGMAVKEDGSAWMLFGGSFGQQVAGAVVEVRPSWVSADLASGTQHVIEMRLSQSGLQNVTRLEVTRQARTELRSLLVDGPPLAPAFDRSVRSYALGTHADSRLRLRPAPANPNSVVEVRVNGGAWASVAPVDRLAGRMVEGYVSAVIIRGGGMMSGWDRGFPTRLVASADFFSRSAVSAGFGENARMYLLDDGSIFASLEGSPPYASLSAPLDLRNQAALSLGERHAVALSEDGRVRAWGNNEDGKLAVPPGLPPVAQVRAGRDHSLALLANGTVVAWGKNDAGQCSVPAGLSGVVSIAAGHSHSMALRRNGTVAVWGVLGDGSSGTPAGVRRVSLIAADGGSCVAVTEHGTAVRWGDAGSTYGPGATPTDWNGLTDLSPGYRLVYASLPSHQLRSWKGEWLTFPPPNGVEPEPLNPSLVTLPLVPGANTIEVRVTDPQGGATSLTTLTVTRIANPDLASLKLTGFPLTPAFDPAVGSYTTEVAARTDSLTLNLGAQESDATLTVNGAPVSGGAAVVPLPAVPTGPIVVSVTSGDGSTTRSYQLNVTRAAPSSVAGLGLLTTSVGPLTPPFDPQINAYQQEHRFAQASLRAVPLGAGSRLEVRLNDGPWQDLFHGQRLAQTQSGSLIMGPEGVPFSWPHGESSHPPLPPGLSKTVSVAGYNTHMLALRPDGTVVAWGDNSRGQSTVPDGLRDVIAVAAGHFHSMALRQNGQVVVWGSGEAGLREVPPDLNDVTAISAGMGHCLALRRNGTVVTWGDTSPGLDVPSDLTQVTAIAAVNQFSTALKADGRVVQWGQWAPSFWPALNVPALLDPWGVGVVEATGLVAATYPPNSATSLIPSDLGPVVSLLGNRAVGIAVQRNGAVRTWSAYPTAAPEGTLGDTRPLFLPFDLRHGANTAVVRVTAEDGVTQESYQIVINRTPNTDLSTLRLSNIALSPAYQPGVTQLAATVPSFQTTTEITAIASDPTSVVSVNGVVSPTGKTAIPLATGVNTVLVDVAASDGVTAVRHTLTITREPSLATLDLRGLGSTAAGMMAVFDPGLTTYTTTPPDGDFRFWPLLSNPATAVAFRHNGGAWQTLNATGSPPAAGNSSFVIALRTSGTPVAWSSTLNTVQSTAAGLTDIVAVAAGSNHAMALNAAGKVVVWGTNVPAFQPPATLAESSAIAAGRNHCLALGLTGTVIAWGTNTSNQTRVPAGLPPIMAIAGGGNHSLALSRDGRVFSWGSMAQNTVPTTLPPVVMIAAGDDFSVALKNDGTVAAWGANTNGQRTPPAGLSGVVQIACGGRHVLALRSNGTVTAWGDNASGQSTVPPGLTDVVAVNAGGSFSLAVKRDGRLVVWGASSAGQRNIPADLVMPALAMSATVPPLPGDGTSEIRITPATGADTRTYAIQSSQTLPDAYLVWAASVFPADATAASTTPAADYDQDGLANSVEFLGGSNPVRPSGSPLNVSITEGMLEVRWPRQAGWPDGWEILEGSPSLRGPWSPLSQQGLTRTPGEAGAPDILSLRQPMVDGSYFLRLRMPPF